MKRSCGPNKPKLPKKAPCTVLDGWQVLVCIDLKCLKFRLDLNWMGSIYSYRYLDDPPDQRYEVFWLLTHQLFVLADLQVRRLLARVRTVREKAVKVSFFIDTKIFENFMYLMLKIGNLGDLNNHRLSVVYCHVDETATFDLGSAVQFEVSFRTQQRIVACERNFFFGSGLPMPIGRLLGIQLAIGIVWKAGKPTIVYMKANVEWSTAVC